MIINRFIIENEAEEALKRVSSFLDAVVYGSLKHTHDEALEFQKLLEDATAKLMLIQNPGDKTKDLLALADALRQDFKTSGVEKSEEMKELIRMADVLENHIGAFSYSSTKGLSLNEEELTALGSEAYRLADRLKSDGDLAAYVELLELARKTYVVMQEMFDAQTAADLLYLVHTELSWSGTRDFLKERRGLEIYANVVCAFFYLEGIVERGEYLRSPIPRI